MVVAVLRAQTRGSNNSEGSVGTAALRDIAVPDPPSLHQHEGISGCSAAVEPISDKFPTPRGLSGGSCYVPRDLAAGQLGPAVVAAAAAAKCSRDCSSAAGKICYRTKGGEGQERGEGGEGAFVIIIGHRLTVTGYKQSQLRQQCENWAKSGNSPTIKNPKYFAMSSIYEPAGSISVAERGDSVCLVLTHGATHAHPRPTSCARRSQNNQQGRRSAPTFYPDPQPTLMPALATFSGSLVTTAAPG